MNGLIISEVNANVASGVPAAHLSTSLGVIEEEVPRLQGVANHGGAHLDLLVRIARDLLSGNLSHTTGNQTAAVCAARFSRWAAVAPSDVLLGTCRQRGAGAFQLCLIRYTINRTRAMTRSTHRMLAPSLPTFMSTASPPCVVPLPHALLTSP